MILKKKFNLWKILRKGKAFFLAYDQGLEHGSTDFNLDNVDPKKIIDIAKEGKFTALIFQKGIAEKYINEIKKSKVPLIVKLNGKTSLIQGDPVSRQICTVEEAVSLGARAVGYTIYIGSIHEEDMFLEFAKIQEQAHKKGLPVIAWIYPRGKGVKGKNKRHLLAYASRVGLEIGADIVKIHSHGNKDDLAWAVKNAGRTKVVIAGGEKTDEKTFLKKVNTLDVSRYLGVVPYPYSIKDAKWFINKCLKDAKKENRESYELAIELKSENKIIGVISLTKVSDFHKTATLGYWLAKDYWRNGIMKEACIEIINFGFSKLKLRRLNVRAYKENIPSNSLIKKLGFNYEGTMIKSYKVKSTGKIHDENFYAMLKEDWVKNKKRLMKEMQK